MLQFFNVSVSVHTFPPKHDFFGFCVDNALVQVNLLDRIKSSQVKREIAEWLNRLLRRYDRTGKVMEIFS